MFGDIIAAGLDVLHATHHNLSLLQSVLDLNSWSILNRRGPSELKPEAHKLNMLFAWLRLCHFISSY